MYYAYVEETCAVRP